MLRVEGDNVCPPQPLQLMARDTADFSREGQESTLHRITLGNPHTRIFSNCRLIT